MPHLIDEVTKTLAVAKLKESGLTIEDAELLGIEILPPHVTMSIFTGFQQLPSLKLNYYDFDKNPLVNWPKHDPFYRIRYLAKPTGFSSAKEIPKYTQPPNTGCAAYFPRIIDWRTLLINTSHNVIITEGELKAACASKLGYHTIGLGGVHNYKSTSRGQLLIPELVQFTWKKRPVYITYDSDFKRNPLVCHALNSLAEELKQQGAYPFMISLPDIYDDGRKTGLDDFLVSNPHDFAKLINQATPITTAQKLWNFNRKFVYVFDPGLIVEQSSGRKINPSAFKEHQFCAEDTPERVVKANGDVSMKCVSTAQMWLRWRQRFEVDRMTYQPGKDKIVKVKDNVCFNTWTGWGCEPEPGDVEPFIELISHLFEGSDPHSAHWFFQWLAYPLKYPGTKMFTSVVMHGIHQGTGKSLVGYTMGKIYGLNFTEITQQSLHSNFNEWAENKQFVLADDVTGSNKRSDADMLKKMITQKELRVNPKYVSSYVVPDCINYFFTTNRVDSFFLEDNDRRFFIHEILVNKKDEEFYSDYDLWLHGRGPSHLFHYLLNDVDISDFNPFGQAHYTSAKERMIYDVKSDLEMWVLKLKADPNSALVFGNVPLLGDLFTNTQLRTLYDPEQQSKITANGMGRALHNAGIQQVDGGRLIRGPEGLDRWYIIRNYERWIKAGLPEITEHISETYKIRKSPKF